MANKIFHVTTGAGEVYGVAASNKTEAKVFVQQRLTSEESTDYPAKANYVGTSDGWVYGTTLWY